MLIKVKFTKDEKPCGREYTYRSRIQVKVGELVKLPNGGTGIVTSIDVPEAEVKSYADRVREIVGLKEEKTDDSERAD